MLAIQHPALEKVELLVQRPNSTSWEALVVKRVSLKKAIELNNRSPFE
jgi:hypothetical protein